jgi:hypothetical protein
MDEEQNTQGASPPEQDQTSEPELTVEALQARLVESNAERDKAVLDLKSVSTGRQKQQSRDDVLLDAIREVREDAVVDRRINGLLAKAIGSGDTDTIEEDIAQVNRQAEQVGVTRQAQAQYTALLEDFAAANKDEQGIDIVPLDSSERASIVADWDVARESGDLQTIVQLDRDWHKLILRTERANIKAQNVDALAEAGQTNKKLKEASLDLDAGGGGGTTAVENLTPIQRIERGLAKNALTGEKSIISG